MMNRNFGKRKGENEIEFAPDKVTINGCEVHGPNHQEYLKADDGPWKHIVDERPEPREGYTYEPTGWEESEVECRRVYAAVPIQVTQADYDAAMEEHIRQAREERGYTTREPSEYLSSSVPRWAQDAADFVRFRDAVMLVGLKVINEYAQTGVAPSLAEFRAMLPKCEWTFVEEA